MRGAIVLTAIALLSACSGGGGNNNGEPSPSAAASGKPAEANVYKENGLPKDQQVTLRFAFFEGGNGRDYIDHAIATFQNKFPNVKIELTSSPTIANIINTRITANNDDDMFDIMSSNFNGANELAQAGKLAPLEDLWDREAYDTTGKKLKDLVQEGVYDSNRRIDGKSYDLPISVNNAGLFYDKTFFQQNGWNESPQTWQEFVALLDAIKAKGIVPITFPGVYATYIDYAFGPKPFELAEANGKLKEFTQNYRNWKLPQYLAPEVVEKWNRIYELGKKGYFPDGLAALNHTQSQMQMLQHKAALVSTGDWVQTEMKDAVPDNFKWGFMAVPFGSKPDQPKFIVNSFGAGLKIWAKKPELNVRWAKEFVLWLFNMDIQTYNAEKGGMQPIRNDYSSDSARMSKLQDAQKAIMEYKLKNNARFVNIVLRDVTLDSTVTTQINKMYTEGITEIALGKKAPNAMLESLEARLKQALEGK